MKRREVLKMATLGTAGAVAVGVTSCCSSANENETTKTSKMLRKYTNDDFYVNGKLSPEKTLQAYKELFVHYNYPINEFLLNNIFITDFELGDFANAGMAGIFWYNDATHSYFAHEIFLLPGQMIVEHRHVATEHPAKMESWHVRHGAVFTFGEGDETPNNPKTPESQKDFITVNNAMELKANGINTLNRAEAAHFMIASDQGAIVSEYANYHDGNGLRFTNPNVVFTDILGNI
ncbi:MULTISPECIES: hypothetical protein [unclassified Carboxylicivirga]|uniref:hypothetical protein n=1 Tax=Carboxylicivirga TaxID=1628153 RepID=UPI003D3390F4